MILGIYIIFEWDWKGINCTFLIPWHFDLKTFKFIIVSSISLKFYLSWLIFMDWSVSCAQSLYLKWFKFLFVAGMPIKWCFWLRPMIFSTYFFTIKHSHRIHNLIICIIWLICTFPLEFDLILWIKWYFVGDD